MESMWNSEDNLAELVSPRDQAHNSRLAGQGPRPAEPFCWRFILFLFKFCFLIFLNFLNCVFSSIRISLFIMCVCVCRDVCHGVHVEV